jgi:hypothetical protein
MAINQTRAERFARKSDSELTAIAKTGSLSAAAAEWELLRRNKSAAGSTEKKKNKA